MLQDDLHLLQFCKLACMRVNLAGKNKTNISCLKSNVASAMAKVWVESEYYLNSDNEGKKQYKEKLTLSNGELLPDPNVLDVYWMEGRSSLST